MTSRSCERDEQPGMRLCVNAVLQKLCIHFHATIRKNNDASHVRKTIFMNAHHTDKSARGPIIHGVGPVNAKFHESFLYFQDTINL